MIIALLALASAMIVGGLLAAFFGWDIVLIERGWTMVIAGSFSAACGALLLGVTAAVSKLAQIQAELARLQTNLDEEPREEASPSLTGVSVAALAGGLLGGRMLGRGDVETQEDAQEKLAPLTDDERFEPAAESRLQNDQPKGGEPFLPFPPRAAFGDAETHAGGAPENKVPDFLLAERLRESNAEARISQAEVSLFGDEPRLGESAGDRSPSFDQDDVFEPAHMSAAGGGTESVSEPEAVSIFEDKRAVPAEPSHEEPSETQPSGATVIGTYDSGDNTYVMFSDGSIQAQTPAGIFRFQSLDELKAFIASGGEGGASTI